MKISQPTQGILILASLGAMTFLGANAHASDATSPTRLALEKEVQVLGITADVGKLELRGGGMGFQSVRTVEVNVDINQGSAYLHGYDLLPKGASVYTVAKEPSDDQSACLAKQMNSLKVAVHIDAVRAALRNARISKIKLQLLDATFPFLRDTNYNNLEDRLGILVAQRRPEKSLKKEGETLVITTTLTITRPSIFYYTTGCEVYGTDELFSKVPDTVADGISVTNESADELDTEPADRTGSAQ